MSTNGRKAINVDAAKKENPELEITPLKVGDILITAHNIQQEVKSITEKTYPMSSVVYNFLLDGDSTYYADGYLVHNVSAVAVEEKALI